MVVRDHTGLSICRESLNQFFNSKQLVFDSPVHMITEDYNDYNNDNLPDIPIGFPTDDESQEFQYVIFSVGKDGRLFTLPGTGYKKEGFVYAVAGSHSTMFTQTTGLGQGALPAILTGIEIENGSFKPVKYVWDETQFKFKKEKPFIISQEQLSVQNKEYQLSIIQTEYEKPLSPNEPNFNIYKSTYLGSFDLLMQDSSGKVTSRVVLNKYFGNEALGFMESFPIIFKDYNQDGNPDFIISQPDKDSPEFKYVIFSINSEGIIYNLPAVGYKDDGFIYSAGFQTDLSLLGNGEKGITVTLSNFNGYQFAQGKYLWNGSKFVFSENLQ